jgi:hypothetical protein
VTNSSPDGLDAEDLIDGFSTVSLLQENKNIADIVTAINANCFFILRFNFCFCFINRSKVQRDKREKKFKSTDGAEFKIKSSKITLK